MALTMAGEAWNIDAGELRQRVTIQTKTVTGTTPSGAPVRAWSSVDTSQSVWAKVESLTGRKLELARQLVASATHAVTMRYRPLDVQANRLVFGSLVLNISNISNVENRNVRLNILCTQLNSEVAP